MSRYNNSHPSPPPDQQRQQQQQHHSTALIVPSVSSVDSQSLQQQQINAIKLPNQQDAKSLLVKLEESAVLRQYAHRIRQDPHAKPHPILAKIRNHNGSAMESSDTPQHATLSNIEIIAQFVFSELKTMQENNDFNQGIHREDDSETSIPGISQIHFFPSSHALITFSDSSSLQLWKHLLQDWNTRLLNETEMSRWIMVSFRDPEYLLSQESICSEIVTSVTKSRFLKVKMQHLDDGFIPSYFVFRLKKGDQVERLLGATKEVEKLLLAKMKEVHNQENNMNHEPQEKQQQPSIKKHTDLQVCITQFPEMIKVEKEKLRKEMMLVANKAARNYPLSPTPDMNCVSQLHAILMGDQSRNMTPQYSFFGGQMDQGWFCCLEFGAENIFFDSSVRIISFKQAHHKAAKESVAFTALFYLLHELGVTAELEMLQITQETVQEYARVAMVGKTKEGILKRSRSRGRGPSLATHGKGKSNGKRKRSPSVHRPLKRSRSRSVSPHKNVKRETSSTRERSLSPPRNISRTNARRNERDREVLPGDPARPIKRSTSPSVSPHRNIYREKRSTRERSASPPRRTNVTRAVPSNESKVKKRSPVREVPTEICISNLPQITNLRDLEKLQKDLYERCEVFGHVHYVYIHTNKAMVLFANENSALSAVRSMHGQSLWDSILDVTEYSRKLARYSPEGHGKKVILLDMKHYLQSHLDDVVHFCRRFDPSMTQEHVKDMTHGRFEVEFSTERSAEACVIDCFDHPIRYIVVKPRKKKSRKKTTPAKQSTSNTQRSVEDPPTNQPKPQRKQDKSDLFL